MTLCVCVCVCCVVQNVFLSYANLQCLIACSMAKPDMEGLVSFLTCCCKGVETTGVGDEGWRGIVDMPRTGSVTTHLLCHSSVNE